MTGVKIANNGRNGIMDSGEKDIRATTVFGRVWLLMEIQTRIQIEVLVVTQTVLIAVFLHPGAWI